MQAARSPPPPPPAFDDWHDDVPEVLEEADLASGHRRYHRGGDVGPAEKARPRPVPLRRRTSSGDSLPERQRSFTTVFDAGRPDPGDPLPNGLRVPNRQEVAMRLVAAEAAASPRQPTLFDTPVHSEPPQPQRPPPLVDDAHGHRGSADRRLRPAPAAPSPPGNAAMAARHRRASKARAGAPLDVAGYHALRCPAGPHCNRLHSEIVRALTRWISSRGGRVDIERCATELYRLHGGGVLEEARVDSVISWPGAPAPAWVDAAVRSAAVSGPAERLVGHEAADAEHQKRNRCGATAEGRLGASAQQFIAETAAAARELGGQPTRGRTPRVFTYVW
ncbi:unnamed protein product [Prorocentrum cordatum]|uniref:Uncharacterized protein n=1 Tax=Prorocentrum cordatum TaxID=2364126 RepID=A0ABN9SS66_9DINO|nr:unnamed protein product [Polarella glacialis]